MKLEHQAWMVIPLCPLACAGLVALVAPGGATFAGWPVYGLCVTLAFLVQWVMFVDSWVRQTEHLFDLTGSVTYVSVALAALVLTGAFDARSLLITAAVVVWASRLGSFLFHRVRQAGHDSRFRTILPSFPVLLMTWTLQGTWVSLTASCVLVAVSSATALPLDLWAVAGITLWCTGFAVEVIADRQKQAFRADPDNRDRFITSGLWSWSRHPNYFGEITLWIGLAIASVPVLTGWQHVALASPLFVGFLLTRVSGVRMLEKQAEKRWGRDPDYVAYRDSTSPLIPLPPTRKFAAA